MSVDPTQKDWQTKIFEWFAGKSPGIISLFHFFCWVFVIFVAVLAYLEFTDESLSGSIYSFGRNLGQTAITLLGIVVLPGILGRFKIEIKLTRIITLFRRQLGITVFLLGFSHYLLIRLVPTAKGLVKFQFPYPVLFENFGALALFVLFFMFLTSNNISVKKLGPWWKRLHRFVYLAIWVLVFHTFLQRVSIWSLWILAIGVLEVLSWVYDYWKKKSLNQVAGGSTSRSNGSAGQN